jgi:hypothetical protein
VSRLVKAVIGRGQFLLDLVGASEETQMYRCLSCAHHSKSIEWRNDRQSVYQRLLDLLPANRRVAGVADFYLIPLIGTVHTGTLDAAVDRNTYFGAHCSIEHQSHLEGV